ncbi:MAG: hypothetical protein II177_03300 [Lachnospiraceae bacterium]|nr:hypothetical protein [Lachnospiraceae bacterium]
MRSWIVGILVSVMAISLSASPVFAGKASAEPEAEITTETSDGEIHTEKYPLSSLGYEVYDAAGNLVDASYLYHLDSYSITDSTIPVGGTKYFFPSNNSNGFKLSKDIVVTVSLRLNKAVRVKTFLTKGSSLETTGQSPTVNLVPYETGRMKVGITNKSNEKVTVKSGTISW